MEEQVLKVDNWKRMGSIEDCRKGYLPKSWGTHRLKTGPAFNRCRTVI